MDFSVLSKYDDLLASYFLDSLYLWFSTVRMNMNFALPEIDTAHIVDVIRDKIVKQRDPSKAAMEFLKLPYFQNFLQDKSDKRKSEFTQHLKRYMYMFMPNAGFEIASTERYTGKMEACIVATRDWEAGEQMTCCQGAIAELNSEEDARLKKEGRDFSVMVSTRKKCTCLFLGPARFMNHDCDANCEFILLNQNAITFRINRNITQGEEMTVFYGEHYFGEDNCECLCASCERRKEGSFSDKSKATSPANNSSNNNNDNENTSNNSNDGTDDKSPASPLSSSSSSADKKKKEIRKSSRKRKEISYKDYFEPIEPKKGRRGRSAKYMELEEESLLVEQPLSPSQQRQQRQKRRQQECQYADSVTDGSCSVDLDNAQPPQHYFQKKKKKIESTRHHEMNLSFICENMTPPNDTCHRWVHIPAYPIYDPLQHLKEKEVLDKAHWDELSLDVKSMGRKKCAPGEAVLVPVPPLLASAYNPARVEPILNDEKVDFKKMKEEEESQLLSQFYEWNDRLSDISEPEEDFSGPCCSNYVQETANKVTNMCARCHRHYSIYGFRWPIRKIRRAPVKRKTQKKTQKQVTQQTIQQEPSPASTVSTSTPPSFFPIPPPHSPRNISQNLPTSSSSSPPPPTATTLDIAKPIAKPIATTITTAATTTTTSIPPSLQFFFTPSKPQLLLTAPPPAPPSPSPSSPSPSSPLLLLPPSQEQQQQQQQQQQQPNSIITNDITIAPQKITSDTMDTTIDELKVSSLSSYQPLISDTISIQRLRHSLHYPEEMEFENSESSSIGSNRCSSQFSSLVSHVSIDLYRD